jgi:hypothetical protein
MVVVGLELEIPLRKSAGQDIVARATGPHDQGACHMKLADQNLGIY